MYLLYSIIAGLVSFGTIFYKFPFIPHNISFDEFEFAKLALSLAQHPVIYSPLATGHATPYFYVILASFKLFGISTFSLRFPSAIFGFFSVLLLFKLFRRFYSLHASVLGTLIFATSRWVFEFSRFSFEGSYLLFWELTTILLILKYTDSQKLRYFIFSVLACVLTFYSYLPGRIFFLLPTGILLWNQKTRKLGFVFILLFLLSTIPLLLITSTIESRVSSLSYLLNNTIAVQTKITFFIDNVVKIVGMFTFSGDLNGRHNFPGKPALNPFLAVIFVVGFILAMIKRDYKIFYWWLLISILPSLFVYPIENPHFLRTYTATVAVGFFCTFTIDNMLKLKKTFVTFGLLIIIFLSCSYEIRTYFKYQSKVFKQAFEVSPKELQKLRY